MQIKNSIQTIIPRTVLFLVFFAFILSLTCPIVETVDAADPIASSANSGVAVKAKPALSVGLSSAFNMEIQPSTTGGTFAKQTANLTIATNNVTGYKAYLYTSNGKSTLDPKNPNNTSTINAVTSASTEADFPMNSWGYSLSKDAVSESTTYSAISTTNDDNAKVIETESATASDSYNFTIGTLVDLSLPNDTYKNEAVLSVVANPKEIISLSDATYMQEMSADICDRSELEETTRLIDIRDNKSYWVAKLADGHCWMTQNLALDLSTDRPLTPEDSDVSNIWVPTSSTSSNSQDNSGDDGIYAKSFNLGLQVLTYPASGNELDYVNSSDSAFSDSTGTGILTLVTDEWRDTYAASGDGVSLKAVDVVNKTYDAHYLIGNYYRPRAATANSIVDDEWNKEAPDSICPRGWKLPSKSTVGEPSYVSLLAAYDISSSTSNTNTLPLSPLYYVYSGLINGLGEFANFGTTGGYFLNFFADSLMGGYSYFYISGVSYGEANEMMYFSRSIRCVAR